MRRFFSTERSQQGMPLKIIKKKSRIFGNFITQHFLWIYIIFHILIQPKNPTKSKIVKANSLYNYLTHHFPAITEFFFWGGGHPNEHGYPVIPDLWNVELLYVGVSVLFQISSRPSGLIKDYPIGGWQVVMTRSALASLELYCHNMAINLPVPR